MMGLYISGIESSEKADAPSSKLAERPCLSPFLADYPEGLFEGWLAWAMQWTMPWGMGHGPRGGTDGELLAFPGVGWNNKQQKHR